MAFTRSWNEADPADGDQARYGGQEIRDLKVDVKERLNLEHLYGSLTTDPFGMHAWKVVSKTAGYTATLLDNIILVNASGGEVTIGLPTAIGSTGKPYLIKKTDSSENKVIIDPNGSETIDGVLTVSLVSQYSFIQIISNGSNWVLVSGTGDFGVSQYTFRAYGSGSDQSIASDTWTKVTVFNTESYDPYGMFASNTITIPAAGKYLFICSLDCQYDIIGRIQATLYSGGNLGVVKAAPGVVNRCSIQIMDIYPCTGGQTIDVYIYQTAMTNFYVKAGSSTWLAVTRIA